MKLSNTSPYSDSSEDKFPDTYQIVEMLEVMKERHINSNRNMVTAGFSHLQKPWKTSSVSVEDIMKYIYEKEGLDL